jgi:hypothetical protein
MANFLWSRLAQDETVTAGGALMTHDLPVNPLSAILYTIRAQVTTLGTGASLANLLGAMARVEVIFKGQAIVSARLDDLYAVAYYLLGRAPHQGRKSDAAALARVWITVPILLGRRAWWAEECFPSVRRGELQLQSTPAATFTNISNVTLQVETLELLEATPRRFTKYTTISKTPTATGDHDVDIPIGNPVEKVILYGTTVPVDASDNASIGQLRLLVDNVEIDYALTNWESLKTGESLTQNWDAAGSEGTVRTGAAAPTGSELLETYQFPAQFLRNYAVLNFDPYMDGGYQLLTEGRARVHLRITADVADAIRVIPVELIGVAGAPAA